MSEENKFLNIGYEDFRRLAQDDTLSKYERIGFPDNYREGHEGEIYSDIVAKLSNLKRKTRPSSTSVRDVVTFLNADRAV